MVYAKREVTRARPYRKSKKQLRQEAMSTRSVISKAEMAKGFAKGRGLVQEEWAHPDEIVWLNELIAEGKAVVTDDWKYKDNFQCKRRRVLGVVVASTRTRDEQGRYEENEERADTD